MTDKQKLDEILLLLNPVIVVQNKTKTINTKTRAYISKQTDLAAERIRGKKNLC